MIREIGTLKTYYRWFIWVVLSSGFFISKELKSKEFIYRIKEISPFHSTFNKEVRCVTSDDKGYLWLGTSFSLFRYDGYNTDEIKLSNKLNSEIYKILYHDKNLYLATKEGIFTVNFKNYEFVVHKLDSNNNNPVLDITTDADGNLWWVDGDGFLYKKNTNNLTKIKISNKLQRSTSIICFHNTLWLSQGDSSLISLDIKTSKINRIYYFNKVKKINSLCNSENNDLLLCTESGVFKLLKNNNKKDFEITKLSEYGDSIQHALFINNQAFITKMNLDLVHHYTINRKIYNEIVINRSRFSIQHSKSIWYNNQVLLPTKNGLTVIEAIPKEIKIIHPISNNIDGDCRGITEDKNFYYLFSYMNIVRVNKQTNKVEKISDAPLISHGIFHDGNTIWIASETKGLLKLNTSNNQIDEMFKNDTSISKNLICIHPINEDSLFIGAYKSILIYNKKTNKTTILKPKNSGNQIFTTGFTRQIDTLRKDIYIVATTSGLYKLDKYGKILLEFGSKIDSSLNMNTNCFWINSRKEIWSGTTNGIIIFDSTGKKINQINVDDGLAGNKIASITADEIGNLWIGTFTGLSKITTSDLSIKNYYQQQGLPDNEFNHSSNFRTSKGKILLGTLQGYIEINPLLNDESKYQRANIFISKIDYTQNNYTKQYIYNGWDNKMIQIGKEIKYIRLYITRLPIQFNNNISFSYKINNLFLDKINISNTPIITLMDGKAGKYDVDIYTNDLQGSDGINELIIPYRVNQYFYTNKWFYVFVLGCILFLIIAYLYSIILQNKRLLDLRAIIARDLHDEIGGSMTALLMYTELLRLDKPPTKKQIENLQYTARKIMINFKDGLWAVNTGSDTALQFWDHFKDAVTELTSPFNIYIEYEEPTGLDLIKLSVSVKRNLLLSLKEALNNAIKHGNKENIMIKWENHNHKHTISIVNSLTEKTSLDIEHLNFGIGLNSMKKRLQDIGGNVTYEVKENKFKIEFHLNFIK